MGWWFIEFLKLKGEEVISRPFGKLFKWRDLFKIDGAILNMNIHPRFLVYFWEFGNEPKSLARQMFVFLGWEGSSSSDAGGGVRYTSESS